VAVEKLAQREFAEIASRREALQTIFARRTPGHMNAPSEFQNQACPKDIADQLPSKTVLSAITMDLSSQVSDSLACCRVFPKGSQSFASFQSPRL
jgi:hypothetical protein